MAVIFWKYSHSAVICALEILRQMNSYREENNLTSLITVSFFVDRSVALSLISCPFLTPIQLLH